MNVQNTANTVLFGLNWTFCETKRSAWSLKSEGWLPGSYRVFCDDTFNSLRGHATRRMRDTHVNYGAGDSLGSVSEILMTRERRDARNRAEGLKIASEIYSQGG
jgi:hypothetical protein